MKLNSWPQTILGIDRDEDRLRGMETYFENAGYTILVTTRGDWGLKINRLLNPDVLLVDAESVSMADLRQAQSDRPVYSPAIIGLGNGPQFSYVRTIKAGECIYVKKPVFYRELRALLERYTTGLQTTQAERWAFISRERNAVEPKLRRFILTVLRNRLGPLRWIDPVLAILPEHTRQRLQGIDALTILREHLYFSNLIVLFDQYWTLYFNVLEKNVPTHRVTRSHLNVLLEFINAQRADAHAKSIGDTEFAALVIAFQQVGRTLDAHLAPFD